MKHLFFYTLSLFCIVQPLYSSMSSNERHLKYKAARLRMRKAHNSIFRSIVLPRTATPVFEYNMNVLTIVLTGLTKACDWLQPIQTRTAYLDVYKSSTMAKWALLYSVTWWIKKILACNEIYRVGSRIHQKPHNILGVFVSICKMLSIGGERVAEPEHLEKTSRILWGDRFRWEVKGE